MKAQKYRVTWTVQSSMNPAANAALGHQMSNIDEMFDNVFKELRRLQAEIDTKGTGDGGPFIEWSVLTNGDPVTPELIFTSFGDVIMVHVP